MNRRFLVTAHVAWQRCDEAHGIQQAFAELYDKVHLIMRHDASITIPDRLYVSIGCCRPKLDSFRSEVILPGQFLSTT